MRGERGKRSLRIMSHLIVTLFEISIVSFCIIMISCGLPTAEYLFPPDDFSSANGVLVIYHNKENIDEPTISSIFLGYEIYYRVFDDKNEAEQSYYNIRNMTSSNVIQTANYYQYYPLKHRISASGQYSLDISPLIKKESLIKVSSNKYNLNMNTQGTWTLTDEGSNTVIDSIVRNRSDTASSADIVKADFYRSSEYKVGDRDYAGTNSVTPGGSVYIVFFAFAYGFDPSTMKNVYSDPVILEPSVEYIPGGT